MGWQDDPVLEDEKKKKPAYLSDEAIDARSAANKERQAAARETYSGLATAGGYGAAQGLLALPNWAYKKAEKKFGDPKTGLFGLGKLEDSPLYQDLSTYEPETTGQKFAHRIGEYVGSAVGPGAAVFKGAKAINALRAGGVPGVRSLAAIPGTSYAGYEAGSAALGGAAAQTAEEQGYGPTGQAVAGFLGGVASPFVVAPAARSIVRGVDSMTRRAEAELPDLLTRQGPWYRGGNDLGMAGPVPRFPAPLAPTGPTGPGRIEATPEIREEALRRLGDWATARGITHEQLVHFLDTGDAAHIFHSTGPTTQAQALMDFPGLAEYAGSLRRLYPAAAAESDPFLFARRTGIEPPGGLPPTAGLRTYPAGADELLAVPKSGTPSAGTAMRAEEGMRRLMRVHDYKAHGHGATAEETIANYDAALRAQSKPYWDNFDKAAAKTDMSAEPGLQAFVMKWENEAAREGVAGTSKARAINKALNEVTTRTEDGRQIFKNANDVHFGKQTIDDQIENYLEALPGSTKRQVGGMVTELKNDLVDAIKGVKTNQLGQNYTRGSLIHSGGQQTKREVQMGQDLWSKAGDANEVAKIQARFEAMTREQQKRVRLGWTSGYMHELGGRPPGTDPARLVADRERQRIMDWLVERSKDPTGVFADRPKRGRAFMQAIGQERTTENVVQRGSQTAERTSADALNTAMDNLHGISDVIKSAASGNVQKAIMDAGKLALTRMFGMRAEVAAEQMRMLASASAAENRRSVAALRMHLGRSRAQKFADYMSQIAARESAAVLPPLMGEAAQ